MFRKLSVLNSRSLDRWLFSGTTKRWAYDLTLNCCRYDNFVVVTHGLTMRNICMYYFKWTVEEFNLVLNPDNCEYWLLEKNPSRVYRLVSQVSDLNGFVRLHFY